MDDLKPNSNRFKEEQRRLSEKKIEKVVSGNVKVKKKSEASKIKDVFISEDASNIKSYVLMDVLVPAIKKAIKDIVTDGIEMLLYGSTGHGKRGSSSYISYDRFSDRDRRDSYKRYDDRGSKIGYSYDDIILESRGEAEEVLSRMDELISEYKVVSIGDLYDLVGIRDENYMNNRYGWTNIRNAEVVRVRDGYKIRMPKALPID